MCQIKYLLFVVSSLCTSIRAIVIIFEAIWIQNEQFCYVESQLFREHTFSNLRSVARYWFRVIAVGKGKLAVEWFRNIPVKSTLNIFEIALLLCGLRVLPHKLILMLCGLYQLQRVRTAIPVMRIPIQERSKAFQERNKA
jgi:hypothetical protein